jgi:hypothetical protein
LLRRSGVNTDGCAWHLLSKSTSGTRDRP